ncbi:MAG: 8-oxo-dGTP diphosphatase [Lachnospiraceae bacterium]|nr:8-oxo-dGTP diphosphatase [Lachnospiraceae bacterium]
MESNFASLPATDSRSNLTTLCYIEKDGKYLMMHRIKKENDINHDKWVGVGGHFEPEETPEECLLREVKEETGLTLNSWKFRGLVTFQCDRWQTEYMCLYTADGFSGNLAECDEGSLEWIPKEKVYELPLWEGDKIFFRLIEENHPFFSLKLRYEKDVLVEAALNGKPMDNRET